MESNHAWCSPPCYKRNLFLLYFFVSQKSPVIECCIHPADSYQLLFIYAKIKPLAFSLQNFYVFIQQKFTLPAGRITYPDPPQSCQGIFPVYPGYQPFHDFIGLFIRGAENKICSYKPDNPKLERPENKSFVFIHVPINAPKSRIKRDRIPYLWILSLKKSGIF